MKQYISIMGFIVLAITVTGCETELKLDDHVYGKTQMVVNALASTDTTFMAVVTNSEILSAQSDVVDFYDYFSHWIWYIEGKHFNKIGTLWHSFPKKILLTDTDTELTYTVNDSVEIPMKYDDTTGFYISDYWPKSGDRIHIRTRSKRIEYADADVTAYTEVPETPHIELLSYEKVYSKNPLDVIAPDTDACDTLLNITIKIFDKPGESNFYRLRIVNSAIHPFIKTRESTDVFESADPIFIDTQISNVFGLWPKYFSNVFDDHLFDGEERIISLSQRLREGYKKQLKVELEALTEDYYYYLKSVMRYLTTNTHSGYNEPLRIYGNTTADFGILGAMSMEKIIIDI